MKMFPPPPPPGGREGGREGERERQGERERKKERGIEGRKVRGEEEGNGGKEKNVRIEGEQRGRGIVKQVGKE